MTALDDLSLLRSFVRIAESGSISAAARTLRVPQPTLSRHLRRIEERAGVALLRRDTHAMSLTEAGQRLLEDARAVLALADAAQARLGEEQGALRGHLRLFSTVDLGQFLVTAILTEFVALHSGLTAELNYSNRPLRMIEQGHEAGVMVGSFADESVVARRAGEVVRYVVTSPALLQRLGHGEVRRLADLARWPWLSVAGAQFGAVNRVVLHPTTAAGAHEGEDALDIRPVLTLESATGLREAVFRGAGVTLLAEWLVRGDLAAGRLVRLLPGWQVPAMPVHVVYPGARPSTLRTRAFVDFALERLGEELKIR